MELAQTDKLGWVWLEKFEKAVDHIRPDTDRYSWYFLEMFYKFLTTLHSNMLLKRKRQEHPSAHIHEIRAREVALKRRRRELKRYKVALRVAALRRAELKRKKMIMLHISCQDDFSQRIRDYLREEKRVNREADVRLTD